MSVPGTLSAFGAVLGLVFGGAALVGAAFGPTADRRASAARHAASGGHADAMGTMGGEHGAMAVPRGAVASGLAVWQGGYTLEPAGTRLRAGQRARLAFRITDGEGRAVRGGYELESQRELHLIVVRRDLRGYQHLHPTRDAAGTWSTPLTLPEAGIYRAYADFQIAGQRHVLATDLFVPGAFQPAPLPAASPRSATDGYEVDLRTAAPKQGGESTLTFTVTRAGRPVANLQPYLGARGHLVALREGDLAYLHVHPDASAGPANAIQFMAAFPTAGWYRLFLQFRTAGVVHTVPYTVGVTR